MATNKLLDLVDSEIWTQTFQERKKEEVITIVSLCFVEKKPSNLQILEPRTTEYVFFRCVTTAALITRSISIRFMKIMSTLFESDNCRHKNFEQLLFSKTLQFNVIGSFSLATN